MTAGRVIYLNGASSSGKSSVARELQEALAEAFLHLGTDDLVWATLPAGYSDNREWMWHNVPSLMAGFDASCAAFASAGNNIIVDHVIHDRRMMPGILRAFDGLEVLFVGVHCDLNTVEARERTRGDRRIGHARTHYDEVHTGYVYDVEIDTSTTEPTDCARQIMRRLDAGPPPNAFNAMRHEFRDAPIWRR